MILWYLSVQNATHSYAMLVNDHHKRNKRYRGHAVVPLTELKSNKEAPIQAKVKIPLCKEHDEQLKYYCETCDELVCMYCTVKKHNGHHHDSVKQMAPGDQVSACQGFLSTEGVDDYIRRGDIFAVMIAAYLHLGGHEQEAASKVQEMAALKIKAQNFIPIEILGRLQQIAGQMGGGGGSNQGSPGGMESEEIDEEIASDT